MSVKYFKVWGGRREEGGGEEREREGGEGRSKQGGGREVGRGRRERTDG
jgi:hypothetical protein